MTPTPTNIEMMFAQTKPPSEREVARSVIAE